MKNKNTKVVVICGPTASGKTSLALQLAKLLGKADILSVDSRQAYQGLDLVTGKDIPADLPSGIRFFGHDLFSPDQTANLSEYVTYARSIIAGSQSSGRPLIVVGGTGLYLKALTQDLSQISIPPNPSLRRKLEGLSLTDLQQLLRQKDETAYLSLNRSDVMNPRRLIRRLEILSSPAHPPVTESVSSPDFVWIGLNLDKELLKKNIRRRVEARLSAGAVEEVKKLRLKFPDPALPIFTSLGVPQITSYLAGKLTRQQLIEVWTSSELDYARRQMVWFKKQPGIVWYDSDIDRGLLAKDLSKIYL